MATEIEHDRLLADLENKRALLLDNVKTIEQCIALVKGYKEGNFPGFPKKTLSIAHAENRKPSAVTIDFIREANRLTSLKEIEKATHLMYLNQTISHNIKNGKLMKYKPVGLKKPLFGLPEWFKEDGTPKPEYLP